jgi:hypothetical protein
VILGGRFQHVRRAACIQHMVGAHMYPPSQNKWEGVWPGMMQVAGGWTKILQGAAGKQRSSLVT